MTPMMNPYEVNTKRQKLLTLLEPNQLIDLLNMFTDATGLRANIVDISGLSIFSKKEAQKNCEYCRLIRKLETENNLNRCREAYARAGQQAVLYNEPYIFRCPGGLIEWATPIVVDNEHLGSIICGQVLMWEPEDYFWIEIKEMNKEITNDFTSLFEAAKKLQVVSGNKVQSAASLLSIIANHIINTAWEKIQYEREADLQKILLDKEKETRQQLEERLNSQSINYHAEMEEYLISKLRMEDYIACEKVFQIHLTNIIADTKNKLNVFKSRCYELIVVVSRVCLDMGLSLNETIETNTLFMQTLNTCTQNEQIYTRTCEVFNHYIASLKALKSSKNSSTVETIKGYIHQNFSQFLTLEDIANSVYLSPFYAGRVFKEETNVTIMEYVTMVRLEEAKKLLVNPRYKIENVATLVGYNDPSYFSRVFKKKEGISPNQYRMSS